MPPSDVDSIDFKPFFDAVVGVLFVLLILVAAQLFFSSVQSVPEAATLQAKQQSEQQPEQQPAELPLQWEKQIFAFLEDFAQQLRHHDLTPVVSLADRSVSLPIEQLFATGDNPLPRVNRQSDSVGRVLLDRLQCLSRPPSPECPMLSLLHLGNVNVELRLSVPAAAALPPDRYAEYLRVILSAALIQSAPRLLAITGNVPGPSMTSASSLLALAGPDSAASLMGDVAIRFVFQPPQ